MSLDQPLCVVELQEGSHTLARFLDVAPCPCPDALLLQRADEPLGAAVAGRLSDERGRVFDPEPGKRPGEVRARVLGSPVVAARDPPGHVGGELPANVPDPGLKT